MIPQAYVERVAIGLRRLRLAPPAWRLHCLRAALAVLRSCRLSEETGVPVDNMREEFGGEPVAAFSMSHPAVPALYIVLTLGLTMSSMQPVLIALSLAGGLAYGFATRGAAHTLGALRWQLPVILIIALVNPLFSASGSTELFRIGMRAVYLESMVYGLCMGGLFVASVLWFEAAASMLEYDKVLALLGNAAPVIALMISMCMRLIPQFLRRGRTVLAVQDAIDVPGRAPADPVRSRLRASSVLMGWGHGRFGWSARTHALPWVGRRDASNDVCAVSAGAQRRCRAGWACAVWRGHGDSGVDRDDAVFVLSAALGAGAVAGLCRVRCLDGAALRVARD